MRPAITSRCNTPAIDKSIRRRRAADSRKRSEHRSIPGHAILRPRDRLERARGRQRSRVAERLQSLDQHTDSEDQPRRRPIKCNSKMGALAIQKRKTPMSSSIERKSTRMQPTATKIRSTTTNVNHSAMELASNSPVSATRLTVRGAPFCLLRRNTVSAGRRISRSSEIEALFERRCSVETVPNAKSSPLCRTAAIDIRYRHA